MEDESKVREMGDGNGNAEKNSPKMQHIRNYGLWRRLLPYIFLKLYLQATFNSPIVCLYEISFDNTYLQYETKLNSVLSSTRKSFIL